MKNAILILFVLANLVCVKAISKEEEIPKESPKGTLSVYCTPEVLDLTQNMIDQFCQLNPGAKIKLDLTDNKSITAQSETPRSLSVFLDDTHFLPASDINKVCIGRQVVVPIINAKNPGLKDFMDEGISLETLSRLFSNDSKNPQILLNNNKKVQLHYYDADNAFVNSKVSGFLNTDVKNLKGIKVKDALTLIQKIKKDKSGFGFCLLSDVINPETQNFIDGVKVMPIDINSNGHLDYMEDIYSSVPALLRGIWIGKYPHQLYSQVFGAVSENKNEAGVDFLKWMLTDGQNSLASAGISFISYDERARNLDKLIIDPVHNLADEQIATNTIYDTYKSSRKAFYRITGIIMLVFFLGIFIEIGITKIQLGRKEAISFSGARFGAAFNVENLTVPQGLYYDRSHTWAYMEKDGSVKIGIDDFMAHVTGSVTQLKMKKTGEKIRKGEAVISMIHNGKQLNVYAPVTGSIVEQNEALSNDSSLINSSPYNEGWVYRIEPANWLREIPMLITGKKYKDWIMEEFSRLKDFLATALKASNAEYAFVLQDGGEIREGILADLTPEIWEDFQTNFIDTEI